MPQKSAIWVKVSAVFSISHTAVALGISGSVMCVVILGPLARAARVRAPRARPDAGYANRPGVGQGCGWDYDAIAFR